MSGTDTTIDGMPLGESGAVFRLAAVSPVTARYDRDDGWSAEVREDSLLVSVSGTPCHSYADAIRAGLEVAQEGLDIFSARGRADLTTVETENDHLALWAEEGVKVLRVVSTALLRAGFGAGEVQVRDATGAVKPSPRPVESWHQSMRYYRQAQLSEDLFDSLRSLWLAVENLLDSVDQWQTGEREGPWLKRSLASAGAKVDLTRYLPAGSPKAPHNQAFEYFYDELRTSIFHAKGSRDPQLPHGVEGMSDLVERHERLTRFYLDLLGEVTGVRRASGSMTHTGFELMTPGWEHDPCVQVTDDSSPFDPAHKVTNPSGGSVVEARAARERALERPGLKVLLAQIPGSELRRLEAVRRVGLTLGGSLASSTTIDGDLQAGDVDRFEAQLGLRLKNVGLPRSFAAL